MRSTFYGHMENSAIAEHAARTNHIINFDGTKMLVSCDQYKKRIVRYVIEVKIHKNNFNRDAGFHLSPLWNLIL